jgi:hypothetical protein
MLPAEHHLALAFLRIRASGCKHSTVSGRRFEIPREAKIERSRHIIWKEGRKVPSRQATAAVQNRGRGKREREAMPAGANLRSIDAALVYNAIREIGECL